MDHTAGGGGGRNHKGRGGVDIQLRGGGGNTAWGVEPYGGRGGGVSTDWPALKRRSGS